MKYDNQLRYAVNIIRDYDGRHPLSVWLKDFFRKNKQMGSRDRKTISEFVYGYFRLGHNQFQSTEDRMLAALFVCDRLTEIAEYFKASDAKSSALEEFSVDGIFPWKNLLSDGIDANDFTASFLVQPNLFIRVRPGKENIVAAKLDASGVQYSKCGNDCIALANSVKIDAILKLNEEAVVQDKSSQKTGSLIKNIQVKTVWDCCAASGGKSIMAYDIFNHIELTVSDIRESIISNLRLRLKEAAINKYTSFTADLSSSNVNLPNRQYDLIIADVPCSGSGTWSRTPEQLYFFKEEKIVHYAALQQQIVNTALARLNAGGYFLYITCSAFRQENEEIINYILLNKNIRLIKSEIIKGYNEKADTMFAALLVSVPFRDGPASG